MTTVPHVYTAIAEIAGKLAKEGVGKTEKNQQQGYKFRGIDQIYNALASKLAEHNLVILTRVLDRNVVERNTKSGTALFYVTLKVEFDFVSAKDGSRHTVTTYGEAMDSGDKATNKAMSAAYKYACLQAFCIPTEGDNDSDATTHDNVTPINTSVQGALKASQEGSKAREDQFDYCNDISAICDLEELQAYRLDNEEYWNQLPVEFAEAVQIAFDSRVAALKRGETAPGPHKFLGVAAQDAWTELAENELKRCDTEAEVEAWRLINRPKVNALEKNRKATFVAAFDKHVERVKKTAQSLELQKAG